jgi:hypothetical protein
VPVAADCMTSAKTRSAYATVIARHRQRGAYDGPNVRFGS